MAKLTAPQEYGFIPVKYDTYDQARREWSFVECTPIEATHVRHLDTGKMYKSNQHARVFNYYWDTRDSISDECREMIADAKEARRLRFAEIYNQTGI